MSRRKAKNPSKQEKQDWERACQAFLLARTEMEEAIEYRERVCSQMSLMIQQTETQKVQRMTEMFDHLDS